MSLSKCLKRKRTATSFKSGWLEEVETESTQSECTVRLKIREIFSYMRTEQTVITIYGDDSLFGLL